MTIHERAIQFALDDNPMETGSINRPIDKSYLRAFLNDAELVEKISDGFMEHIPSNMGMVFNPNDPTNYKWAKSYADAFAKTALDTIKKEASI